MHTILERWVGCFSLHFACRGDWEYCLTKPETWWTFGNCLILKMLYTHNTIPTGLFHRNLLLLVHRCADRLICLQPVHRTQHSQEIFVILYVIDLRSPLLKLPDDYDGGQSKRKWIVAYYTWTQYLQYVKLLLLKYSWRYSSTYGVILHHLIKRQDTSSVTDNSESTIASSFLLLFTSAKKGTQKVAGLPTINNKLLLSLFCNTWTNKK